MLFMLRFFTVLDLLEGGHVVLVRRFVNAARGLEHDVYRFISGFVQI